MKISIFFSKTIYQIELDVTGFMQQTTIMGYFSWQHARIRNKRSPWVTCLWGMLLISQTTCSGSIRSTDPLANGLSIDPGVDAEASSTGPHPRARVCLDPGHPTYSGDKLYEGILNRKVVYYLSDLLVQNDFAVLITVIDIRKEAIFDADFDNESRQAQAILRPTSLEDRVDACHLWKSDFLISVHHNGGLKPKVHGARVFFGMDDNHQPWHDKTRKWAEITAKHLEQTMEVAGSTVESDQEKLGFSLGILKSQSYMGILTEASYFTISEERERLNTDDYLKGEAEAIFQGFLEFHESLEKPAK